MRLSYGALRGKDMNNLIILLLVFCSGCAIGFSWGVWVKDVHAEHRKEKRVLIDIPFDENKGEALFEELKKWTALIEKHESHNKPLHPDHQGDISKIAFQQNNVGDGDDACPICGELEPVLHCEKCGHNWPRPSA